MQPRQSVWGNSFAFHNAGVSSPTPKRNPWKPLGSPTGLQHSKSPNPSMTERPPSDRTNTSTNGNSWSKIAASKAPIDTPQTALKKIPWAKATPEEKRSIPEGLLRSNVSDFEVEMCRLTQEVLQQDKPLCLHEMLRILMIATNFPDLPILFRKQFGSFRNFILRHSKMFQIQDNKIYLRTRSAQIKHIEPTPYRFIQGLMLNEVTEIPKVPENCYRPKPLEFVKDLIKCIINVLARMPNNSINAHDLLAQLAARKKDIPKLLHQWGGILAFLANHPNLFHINGPRESPIVILKRRDHPQQTEGKDKLNHDQKLSVIFAKEDAETQNILKAIQSDSFSR